MLAIERTLLKGDLQLAKRLLRNEWELVADPAIIYYQVIRDELLATFHHLESSRLCSEWDSFRYCSNALLELNVKNVKVGDEMYTLVLCKLSSYGLRHLCGDPVTAKPKNSWMQSIDYVVRWVQELRSRPKCFDYLDVDNQVLFRIRMIHHHLFLIKDHPATKEIPLREMIFCLAIFLKIHENTTKYDLYRAMINKRNVMKFMCAVVSRLQAIVNQAKIVKLKKTRVLKRLRKTYRRMKQMYSVLKIVNNVHIFNDFCFNDFKRCNASLTVAAHKRYNQICGEAIKSTLDTPNLSKKLSALLPEILTDSIKFNTDFRNISSHGISLSHMFARDSDHSYYYKEVRDFIHITAVSFYTICLCLIRDFMLNRYGFMRSCKTIDDLRAFIRYAGGNTITTLSQQMLLEIERHLSRIQFQFNEIRSFMSPDEQKDYKTLKKNINDKNFIFNMVRLNHYDNTQDAIEVVAFTNPSLSDIYNELSCVLMESSSNTIFDYMSFGWKIIPSQFFSSSEYDGIRIQAYIHQYLEPKHTNNEQWYYREKTKQILNYFTSGLDLEPSIHSKLEDNLHKALSNPRNGYYQNIFAIDSKSQAITQCLKEYIVGPKATRNFKSKNEVFKSKIQDLRHQDKQELKREFEKIVSNLQAVYISNDCETVEKFIVHQNKISLKEQLAIEYWQLQAMEMLYASGYFGDNFCLLTRFVPLIWGKSYRNYLAHDSISYELLSSCGKSKVLINGFVLAFHSSELDIFQPSKKFELDGLMMLETEGNYWLDLQFELLESLKKCDIPKWEDCLSRRAEPTGRHFMRLGHLLRPRHYSLPRIIVHEQRDENMLNTAILLLDPYFDEVSEILPQSKTNYATRLNLLNLDSGLPIRDAFKVFESLQPGLMAPCVGAVLRHLVTKKKFNLLGKLIEKYTQIDKDVIMENCRCPSQVDQLGSKIFFTTNSSICQFNLSLNAVPNNLQLFRVAVDNFYQSDSSTCRDKAIREVLEQCCHEGQLEMVRYLVDSYIHNDFSKYIARAICSHHWKIVKLLLEKEAYEWQDDGIIVKELLNEKNFRMLRKILQDDIPQDHKETFVAWLLRLGSKHLLKHFLHRGLDIWKFKEVLSDAALNKDPGILDYLEEEMFKASETFSLYQELKLWITVLQDLQALMRISIDPEFLNCIMEKHSIAERWITRIADLLSIEDEHFANVIQFYDPTGLFCSGLSENLSNTSVTVFLKTIEKCTNLIGLIQALPKDMFESKQDTSIVFQTPCKTINSKVEVTIYSSIKLSKVTNSNVTINTAESCNIADIIRTGLQTYFQQFKHMQAGTASITVLNNCGFQQFFYLQIKSSICFMQKAPRTQFNVSYLFNTPDQDVLHCVHKNTTPRTIETLLRLGANPTSQDNELTTSFHRALAYKFPLELISLMYEYSLKYHNTNPHVFNLMDTEGNTPLHVAIKANRYHLVKFLLENGADPTIADHNGVMHALRIAIYSRNDQIVQLLIRHCPELVLEYSTPEMHTEMMALAVAYNNEYIVRLLLESGVDLKNGDFFDSLVLSNAIKQESVESLQVLLDFAIREGLSLDTYVYDYDDDDNEDCGSTPLQFAYEQEVCPEIVELLVRYNIQQGIMDLQGIIDTFCLR